jgi:SanA protein
MRKGCLMLVRLLVAVGGATLLLLIALPLALRWWTDLRYQGAIYTPAQAPTRRVAIVFGAGVWPGGVLSDVLVDRVDTAVELYRLGKVEKLLLTGDNSTPYYNEPKHMRDHAIARGVPDRDLVLDYAGRRTYDSCYRARYIFGVTEAILVTQAYHLDRALFTANALGIKAVGVRADRRDYRRVQAYWWRELFATSLAWWQVKITRPEPILGEPLPIFPDDF